MFTSEKNKRVRVFMKLKNKSGEKMITIILCGDKKDKSFHLALNRVLLNYGKVEKVSKTIDLNLNDDRKHFLLYECERIPSCLEGKGIILFKNSFHCNEKKIIPKDFIPIFCTHNVSAAKALQDTGNIAITCGMSPRDTLSVASINFTNAVVSLQRDIKTIYGSVLEPHEFRVRLKTQTDIDSLLITCVVLLLSEVSSDEGYVF